MYSTVRVRGRGLKTRTPRGVGGVCSSNCLLARVRVMADDASISLSADEEALLESEMLPEEFALPPLDSGLQLEFERLQQEDDVIRQRMEKAMASWLQTGQSCEQCSAISRTVATVTTLVEKGENPISMSPMLGVLVVRRR